MRRGHLLRWLVTGLLFAAGVLFARAASAQDSGSPRRHPEAHPLDVKGPNAPDDARTTAHDKDPPADSNNTYSKPAGPVRLSEAAPERLSSMCRVVARDLLRARRRGGPLSEREALEKADFDRMHLDCLDAAGATLTSGVESAGEDALRAVAAVVAKRAKAAAFRLLEERLLAAAGCGAEDARRLPSTCAALRSLPIEDLARSPAVLLDAVVADFLALARPLRGASATPLFDEALRESAVRWRQSGAEGVRGALADIARRELRAQVTEPTCDRKRGTFGEALWVSGMCLIEAQAPAGFSSCDVDGWISECDDPGNSKRILRLWSLLGRVVSAPGKAPLSDLAELLSAAAEAEIEDKGALDEKARKEARDRISAMRTALSGLARGDWVATTSGAIRALRVVTRSDVCAKDGSVPVCADARAAEEVLTLLSALGLSAETGCSAGKDAVAAREKALEEVVERLVGRSHRDSGWVVSVGGSLSLLGGARFSSQGALDMAFPVQLTLGLAVESFTAKDRGFHGAVTFLDLGQYVSMDAGDLKVARPSFESSVVLGVTAGAWLALRETPFFIAAYGGVSPFVRSGETPTFQAGLSTGIYVPFVDF